MIQFQCDYSEGAHPRILERIVQTNFEQTVGYGEDHYCAKAAELIKTACGREDADVHFLVGGTQTNATVISSVLRPHQGVICVKTGHINVHETGAIEHSGHKVLALDGHNGLLSAESIAEAMEEHLSEDGPEHTVQPGMVYISFSSEVGTIYSQAELEAISEVCRRYGLPLFVDGARLGYGLASEGCDVSLKDLARLADVFYIGGTKQGALFGEAVVVTDNRLLKHFTPLVKQHGALLAKGRLLGVQFEALFTDGLYAEISRECVRRAMWLKEIFVSKGYEVEVDSPTNQQFFRLPNNVIDELKSEVSFEMWGPRGETESVVRFVTGWTTTDQDIERLKMLLK